MFDWGDNNNSGWIGPYASGQSGEASYVWSKIGDYEIRAKAKDNDYGESDWSEPATITIVENEPPEKPTISGPKIGAAQRALKFKFVSTDPEGNDLYYMVHWGDGHYMPYQGLYASGEEVTFSHSWSEPGTFTIIAKAKDRYGVKGPQNSIKLTITKNRAINTPFLNFLQQYPNLFPILQKILLLQR